MTYAIHDAHSGHALFAGDQYVVEANQDEVGHLWYRWGEFAGVPMSVVDRWQGVVATIAGCGAMSAHVTWGIVAASHVAFVDLISESQAWRRDAQDAWLRLAFPLLREPDGWRRRRFRSSQFASMLDEISLEIGHPIQMRANSQILQAVRAIAPGVSPDPILKHGRAPRAAAGEGDPL